MEIEIGSVVYWEGQHNNPRRADLPYVIVDMINHENAGSCAYDRVYRMILLGRISVQRGEFLEDQLETFRVYGPRLPFTLVPDQAPFKFTTVTKIFAERKEGRLVYD